MYFYSILWFCIRMNSYLYSVHKLKISTILSLKKNTFYKKPLLAASKDSRTSTAPSSCPVPVTITSHHVTVVTKAVTASLTTTRNQATQCLMTYQKIANVTISRKAWLLITIFAIHSPFLLNSFFRREEKRGK